MRRHHHGHQSQSPLSASKRRQTPSAVHVARRNPTTTVANVSTRRTSSAAAAPSPETPTTQEAGPKRAPAVPGSAGASTPRGAFARQQAIATWGISSADFDGFFGNRRGIMGETALRALNHFAAVQPDWNVASELLTRAREDGVRATRDGTKERSAHRKADDSPWTMQEINRAVEYAKDAAGEGREGEDRVGERGGDATGWSRRTTRLRNRSSLGEHQGSSVVADTKSGVASVASQRREPQSESASQWHDDPHVIVVADDEQDYPNGALEDIELDQDNSGQRSPSLREGPEYGSPSLSLAENPFPASPARRRSTRLQGNTGIAEDIPATAPGLFPSPSQDRSADLGESPKVLHAGDTLYLDSSKKSTGKRPLDEEVTTVNDESNIDPRLRQKRLRTRFLDPDPREHEYQTTSNHDEHIESPPQPYPHTSQSSRTSFLEPSSIRRRSSPMVIVDDSDPEAAAPTAETPKSKDNNNPATLHIPESLLSPKGRLDGATIERLLKVITAARPLTVHAAGTSLKITPHSPILNILRTHRGLETLLVPLHFVGPEHWALAAIPCSTNSSSVALYDSLADEATVQEAQASVRRFIADFRRAAEQAQIGGVGWSLFASMPQLASVEGVQCPQQGNGVDCGVALVVYALFLVAEDGKEQEQGQGKKGQKLNMPAKTDFSLWRDALCLLIQDDDSDPDLDLGDSALLRRNYAHLLSDWDDTVFTLPTPPTLRPSPPLLNDGSLAGGHHNSDDDNGTYFRARRAQVMELIKEHNQYLDVLLDTIATADRTHAQRLRDVKRDLEVIRDVFGRLEKKARIPPAPNDGNESSPHGHRQGASHDGGGSQTSEFTTIQRTLAQRRVLAEQIAGEAPVLSNGNNGQSSPGGNGSAFLAPSEVAAITAAMARQTQRLEETLRAGEDVRRRAERVRVAVERELVLVERCLEGVSGRVDGSA